MCKLRQRSKPDALLRQDAKGKGVADPFDVRMASFPEVGQHTGGYAATQDTSFGCCTNAQFGPERCHEACRRGPAFVAPLAGHFELLLLTQIYDIHLSLRLLVLLPDLLAHVLRNLWATLELFFEFSNGLFVCSAPN